MISVVNHKVSVQTGSVQIQLHPLPVGGTEAVSNGPFRFLDSPPEAVPVSCHFFPVSLTRRLSSERPGPHDMDLDQGRKPDLKPRTEQDNSQFFLHLQ